MDYILRLDMGKGVATKEKTAEQDRLLGGRGLSAEILNREVDPLCHPLGSGNKLVLAPGPLAGTMAPSFGRLSVGAKSPLTGGIKEANAGGNVAQKLDRLGIKAVVVEGKPEKDAFFIVKIDQNGCEFLPAGDLVGKRNYELVARLQERYGDKVGVVSIGPAGEKRMAAASVAVTDADNRPSRHAGRGGLGAVMGAKGLKAIVIDDAGTSRVPLKDAEAFQRTVKDFVDNLKADKGMPRGNSELGTPGVISFASTIGSMPMRNYRGGPCPEVENLFGENIKKLNTQRGGSMHGCMPGCVVRCSIVYHGPEGKHLTSALEYETLALLGSNLEIWSPDSIGRLDRMCDELGLDTIEIGSAVAQAMEAGLIPVGDVDAVLKALEEIEKGTPFGRILGQGATVTAKVYGLDRVPAVRGQAIPAHDPRACKAVGVTYATSAMGADHTAGIDYRDSLNKEGQVGRSRDVQLFMAAMDSMGYCMLAMPTKGPTILPVFAEMLSARYGISVKPEDVFALGARTIKAELGFNEKAGLDLKTDPMPDFLKKEPLPPNNVVFDVDRKEIEGIWQAL